MCFGKTNYGVNSKLPKTKPTETRIVAFSRNARQSRLGLTDPNTRKALGTAYDTIWIPYKLDGEVQQGASGVKMLFSPQQLSWDEY
ncbi:hypothetical protein [Zooshikella ganghwensis]|uniref:Uncharacterized protein n=1 Tax=Zooshikella ganghwensis TaxID=202772 RepID=A0A4P9VEH0_9GAMM|nr:hypothetical protein [Zooshikella ganghwensis]RDH41455.1 hypothetical protein B9G39_28780 [Zooshikella ganghwensis]